MDTNNENDRPMRSSVWRIVAFAAIMLVLAGIICGFTAAITQSVVAAIITGAVVVVLGALWVPRVLRDSPPPEHRPGERPGYEQYGPLGQPNTVGLGNAGGSSTSGGTS
ncbi:hypothetical protein [Microbacterium sp. CIAB417]|uniref:hypothetical protein n=1 Tax=Microbacterium sp. CIAB417 TaxID=2860287 RepID=UPI001FAE750A|nr:hypothetical protein [Microbacterium sp. CIAB417]